MKTLIVEDDFISQKIATKILEKYGDCDIANNGLSAYKLFEKVSVDNKYDLICIDIMMPELDGQELLDKIRSLEEKNNIFGLDRVKIIMTSALDDKNNIIKSFTNQCDGYIVKPVTKEKVEELLTSFGMDYNLLQKTKNM